MPTPNPTLRREFKGAAAATTLVNPMTNADISFVLVAASNWPTGAVGKFIVTINRGQADEEKILCDSQTTRTVACLLANRGFDGTTAQSHAAGATVECTISAFDADEWNQHTNASTGVHGVATVAGLTETQTFTNKTLTGATLDATSTIGGVSGTALASAWTDYSASVVVGSYGANGAIGNGTVYARYKQVVKTVSCDVRITGGSTSTWGTGGGWLTGLCPVPPKLSGNNDDYALPGVRATQATNVSGWLTLRGVPASSPYKHEVYVNGSSTGEVGSFTGQVYTARFTFEAA